MGSNIHLKGSGMDQTILIPDTSNPIEQADFAAISLNNVTNVKITGFTIIGLPNDALIGAYAIWDIGSSPIVKGNRITSFIGSGLFNRTGVAAVASFDSTPKIIMNEFEDNAVAILLDNANGKIADNRIFNNGGWDLGSVRIVNSDAYLVNNTFELGEELRIELELADTAYRVTVTDNIFKDLLRPIRYESNNPASAVWITGNQILGQCNLGISSGGAAIISRNRIGTCLESGITIPSRYPVTVVDNHIAAGASGVFINVREVFGERNNDNIIVSGNIFQGSGGGSGIAFLNTTGVATGNIVNDHAGVIGRHTVAIGNRLRDSSLDAGLCEGGGGLAVANYCSNEGFVIGGQTIRIGNSSLFISGDLNISEILGRPANISFANGLNLSVEENLDVVIGLDTSVTTAGNLEVVAGVNTSLTTGAILDIVTGLDTNITSARDTNITSGRATNISP